MSIKEFIFKIFASFGFFFLSYLAVLENSECNRMNCADGSICIIWAIAMIVLFIAGIVVWSVKKNE